jgi:flavin reductase (DIM6/NTAB) family NADH-FMN oxidoreductase RutF
MAKRSYPLSKVYGLLEPGPVVLLTTARNASFDTLKATKQCVINIPTLELANQVVGVGNCSGRTVDKFAKFGLSPVEAAEVQAPLIKECYASLECKVADTRLVNRYNFFILEVVQAWVDTAVKQPQTLHHRGNGVFAVAGEPVKLRSAMK